jgi:hypothetical protein
MHLAEVVNIYDDGTRRPLRQGSIEFGEVVRFGEVVSDGISKIFRLLFSSVFVPIYLANSCPTLMIAREAGEMKR